MASRSVTLFTYLTLLIIVMASFQHTAAQAYSSQGPSTVQQLVSSGFSGFVQLLEQADLIADVERVLRSAPDGSTIFAPSDDVMLYKLSPTLLAFLKMPHNRHILRKVLLFHIVPERVSAFRWQGAHPTLLSGINLELSMDALAFYANNVAIGQYNALVLDGSNTVVHACEGLLLPPGLVSSDGADAAAATTTGDALVDEVTERRRVLVSFAEVPAGVPAPAPAPAPVPTPAPAPAPAPTASVPPPSSPPPPPRSASHQGLSLLILVASTAVAAAVLL